MQKGNSKTAYAIIGASNHSITEREEHDFYATPPEAVEKLLTKERLEHELWEPACGEGHISKVLKKHGYSVLSTDLIYRGFENGGSKTSYKPLNHLREVLLLIHHTILLQSLF